MTLSERCQNIVTTVTRRLFEATTTAMRPSVLSFDRHDKVASAAIAAAQSARVVVSLGYAKGWCRTSDTYSTPTHVGFGRDQDDPVGRLVQAADPHLLVEHRALLGVGQVQPGSQVAEFGQQGPHHARVDHLLLAGA